MYGCTSTVWHYKCTLKIALPFIYTYVWNDYLIKLYKMQVGFPPFDDNVGVDLYRGTSGALPMLCATEYQTLPHSFQLPAASPYDNFLKAAGCWSCSYAKLHTLQASKKFMTKEVSSGSQREGF